MPLRSRQEMLSSALVSTVHSAISTPPVSPQQWMNMHVICCSQDCCSRSAVAMWRELAKADPADVRSMVIWIIAEPVLNRVLNLPDILLVL